MRAFGSKSYSGTILPHCRGTGCILGSVLVEVNDILWKHLSGTTLAKVGESFETGLTQILPGRAGGG